MYLNVLSDNVVTKVFNALLIFKMITNNLYSHHVETKIYFSFKFEMSDTIELFNQNGMSQPNFGMLRGT